MNNTRKTISTIAAGIPLVLLSESAVVAQNEVPVDLENQGEYIKKLPELPSASENLASRDLLDLPKESSLVEADYSSSLLPNSSAQSLPPSYLAKNSLDLNLLSLNLPSQPKAVQIKLDKAVSLEGAIDQAINNNPNILEARLNLERSQKELQEAKARLFPALSTEFGFLESESAEASRNLDLARLQQGGATDSDLSTSTFNGSLSFDYNLYSGGARGANIKRAEKQVQFNRLNLRQIVLNTRFETVRDYYSLQNADSQVEIEQSAVNDARQTLSDAQLLQQAGVGTRFDVLRAEVELANAVQRLASAKSEQSVARRQLAATLNVEESTDLRTADPVEPAGNWQLSLEEAIVAAYQNRPELKQLAVQQEINLRQKQIALAAIRPQIALVATYDVLDVGNDNVNLTDGYSLGARLQWNIFDGGAAESQARQFDKDLEINQAQFIAQRNLIRLEVEQGYYALVASQENIKTSKQAVRVANESLSLARMRFQAGVGIQTDVIEAQSELTVARANNLRAIVDYNQALNQLKRATTNQNNHT